MNGARESEAPPARVAAEHESVGWLTPRRLRRLCVALLAVELTMGLFNLAYLKSDRRSNEGWLRRHFAEARPRTPPDPSSNVSLEVRRLIKYQMDLDREANFTTWFGSTLYALAAIAAFALFGKRRRRGWLVVGAAFLALSMDEVSQIHEWIGIYTEAFGFSWDVLVAPYPWAVVLGPLFFGFAAWMFVFLRRELATAGTLRPIAVASLVALGLVIPLELLGAAIQGPLPHPPRLAVIAEETLEMVGTTLFTYVALMWMRPREGSSQDAP